MGRVALSGGSPLESASIRQMPLLHLFRIRVSSNRSSLSIQRWTRHLQRPSAITVSPTIMQAKMKRGLMTGRCSGNKLRSTWRLRGFPVKSTLISPGVRTGSRCNTIPPTSWRCLRRSYNLHLLSLPKYRLRNGASLIAQLQTKLWMTHTSHLFSIATHRYR